MTTSVNSSDQGNGTSFCSNDSETSSNQSTVSHNIDQMMQKSRTKLKSLTLELRCYEGVQSQLDDLLDRIQQKRANTQEALEKIERRLDLSDATFLEHMDSRKRQISSLLTQNTIGQKALVFSTNAKIAVDIEKRVGLLSMKMRELVKIEKFLNTEGINHPKESQRLVEVQKKLEQLESQLSAQHGRHQYLQTAHDVVYNAGALSENYAHAIEALDDGVDTLEQVARLPSQTIKNAGLPSKETIIGLRDGLNNFLETLKEKLYVACVIDKPQNKGRTERLEDVVPITARDSLYTLKSTQESRSLITCSGSDVSALTCSQSEMAM